MLYWLNHTGGVCTCRTSPRNPAPVGPPRRAGRRIRPISATNTARIMKADSGSRTPLLGRARGRSAGAPPPLPRARPGGPLRLHRRIRRDRAPLRRTPPGERFLRKIRPRGPLLRRTRPGGQLLPRIRQPAPLLRRVRAGPRRPRPLPRGRRPHAAPRLPRRPPAVRPQALPGAGARPAARRRGAPPRAVPSWTTAHCACWAWPLWRCC